MVHNIPAVLEFDPYDSPPLGLRLGLAIFCLALCALMLAKLIPNGHSTYSVVVIGALLLCSALIATANTTVKATSVTAVYLGVLGLMVVFTPMS